MDGARDLVTNMLEGFALHEIVRDAAGEAVDYRFLDVNPAFERIMGLPAHSIIGRTAREVFPAPAPEWIARYGKVAAGDGPVHFEERSPDLDRWFEVRAYSTRPGLFACTFNDVTDRHREQEAIRLNEALLQSLIAISQRQSHDVQDLLEFALEEAIRLTGSRYGYIYLYDETRQEFQLNTWSRDVMSGCHIQDPGATHRLSHAGLWAEAVRQRGPIVVNDFAGPHPAKRGFPAGHVSLRRFLSIPVLSGRDIVAVLGVADKEAPYGPHDLRQLQLLMEPVWRIVERARADAAIAVERRRMDSILEATGTGMDIVDDSFHLLFVNPGWVRLYGSPEGRTCHEYYYGRETPCAGCNVRQALASKARVVSEVFLPRHGRHYQVTAIPFRAEDGRWQVSEIMVDISERKQADEELRSTKELLQNLLERAPVSIYVTAAADGLLRLVNRQWEIETGRNRLDSLGAGLEDLFPPAEAAAHAAQNAAVIRADQPLTVEETLATAAGPRRFHSVRFPLHDAAGKVEAVGGFSLDITEATDAAEERRRLELKVQHAQKLESLGVLAGGIAHDFNNLLMAVMGNIDLALEDLPAGAAARGAVVEAMTAARKAAGLTNQLLAYSGKGSFVTRSLDLSEVVDTMAGLLRASISRKITLDRRLPAGLPAVEADAAQMQQVVMNLLLNASEAIGPDSAGTISLETGAAVFSEAFLGRSIVPHGLLPGPCVFLKVRDTGCGMSPETMTRMFDPFFSTKNAGRGLGLAAVLGIVRARGGAIVVDSTPGSGAEFTLLFRPATGTTAVTAAGGAEEASPEGWHGAGTVLIADDDEAVLPLASRMVERLGCRALPARDGQEAIELFRGQGSAIRCVILDLTMPRMGGIEACDAILSASPGMPVILSSGYSETDMKARFGGRRIAGFLQKPYRFADLSEILARALALPLTASRGA